MRHKVKTDNFSRFSSYRKATIKSMVIAVLRHQHIITKKVRAKSVRRTVDKIITLGKKGTLSAKRRAFSLLCDHKLVKLLFDTIAPKFANRAGGYTRIIPYRRQRGDNAELAVLELTERYEVKKVDKVVKVVKEEKPQQQDVAKKQEKEMSIKEDISTKEAKPQPVEKEVKKVRKEKIVKKEPEEAEESEEKKEPEKKEEKSQLPPRGEKQKEEKKPVKFFRDFKRFFKKER